MPGIAIVPAFNEEDAIARVIEEIRAYDPDLEIVVVDDGSNDRTAEAARAAGAHVPRLPFNLGIGGAVQTGLRYAHENGFDLAVRVDGDGQHDPAQLATVVEPVLRDEADIAVGSRYLGGGEGYRSSAPRRLGIRILASTVSLLTRQRITDPTSGFQALNRKAIALFAADYPHDYPEVEALVLLVRHRLRLCEVPIEMRPRTAGRSSIRALSSALLHGEGPARVVRRLVSPQRRPTGGEMTPLKISIAASIASIVLLLVVFELIRSRRLRERYALLWLLTGVVLLVLSAWRGGLNTIARWVGVETYPPAILFAVASFFILAVLLHYSTVISNLSDQNSILAQRLALLEQRVDER